MHPQAALRLIKAIHTLVWAIMAGAILSIPWLAWYRAWVAVVCLVLLVLAECIVLFANRMRCPLTDLAAKYTADRQHNFDIYLPLWLARYNKTIFGCLFTAGLVFSLARWQGWPG